MHEKVVEGIESQGLKAAVFDKVFDTSQNEKLVIRALITRAIQVSEDPPETVVHDLIEFVRSNGGDGVVSRDDTFHLSDGV